MSTRPPLFSFRSGTRRRHERRALSGFTAVELLITIAIATILIGIALPSFRTVIARYRVQLATDELTTSIYFARSEAIRRGGRVVLEKNASATGCTTSTAQEWGCGWFVYFDADGNGAFGGADLVLQRSGAPQNVDVMTTNASGPVRLRFDRWGRPAGAAFFGFNLQPVPSSAAPNKLICMSVGGRLQTLTDVTPPCP